MHVARFVPGFLPEPPSGDAYWTPYRGADVLVRMTEPRRARLLRTADLADLALPIVRSQHVGKLNGVPCTTAELAPDAPDLPDHRFVGLRVAYGMLDPAEFDAACMGFQIQHWDSQHRFCAGCGGPLEAKTTERAKRCEKCQRDFYPPVVPAVIVRVEREGHILMTRQSRFPKGMYGLVAGFLEPGETLERCVEREVLEETGIQVKNVRYFGSQPWPFPHQVMVGFTADHEAGEIVVDTSELEEAAWFSRDAMPMLPPPLSIARRLIDDFVEGGKAR
jgi:NAD+ diphosphatase